MKKFLFPLGLLIIISVVTIVGVLQTEGSGLPDLIIESATCKKQESVYTDGFGMPTLLPGKPIECRVTVKNIGNKSVRKTFNIETARNEYSRENDHYSHGQKMNLKKEKIKPGESLETWKMLMNISEEVNILKFRIETFPENESLGFKESNDQNNTYELVLNL